MRKKFAIIGIGQRSPGFIEPLLNDHREHADLVALCDSDMTVLRARSAPYLAQGATFACYPHTDFDRMVAEQKPDTVIVLTPDHNHHEYICRSMELGCDVITEKPLTNTAEKCQQIVDTQARTGRRCTVAFNYRFAPWNTTVKDTLMKGTIGKIVSVNYRMSLGHEHGAFYFHRWHASRKNIGSLLVHKATHFFDLVNWNVSSVPRTVYAKGYQGIFTRANADGLGITNPGERCARCPHGATCPYFRELGASESREIEEARGASSGYYRDMCVFRPEADIPDTMHVMVEYENGVLLNYMLVVFAERGSDIIYYGTYGMLETGKPKPLVTPYYGEPYEITPPHIPGGHGGGDPEMCRHLFDPATPADPYLRASDHHAGAWSALIGIAANRSMDTGQPVVVRDLVTGLIVPPFPEVKLQPEGVVMADIRAWVDGKNRAKTERAAKGRLTLEDTFDANGGKHIG